MVVDIDFHAGSRWWPSRAAARTGAIIENRNGPLYSHRAYRDVNADAAIANIQKMHSGGLMWIVNLLFTLLPLVALAVVIAMGISRARKRNPQPWDGKGAPTHAQAMRMAKSMPSGEALYAMSFPDIAPLFKPDQLLQWQAWYLERRNNQQLLRDGRRWHGEVPGFPGAATMSVKGDSADDASADLVVLQNQAGQTLVEMIAESRPDGSTTLTTDAGSFLLKPSADSKVRFTGTGRSFEWKGPGNWRFQSPVAPAPFQAEGGNLQMADQGIGVGGAVAGLAAGAAVGILAQQALQARAAREQARQNQRALGLNTDY
jgi:hypothetical protein